jgi:hypothetical protein
MIIGTLPDCALAPELPIEEDKLELPLLPPPQAARAAAITAQAAYRSMSFINLPSVTLSITLFVLAASAASRGSTALERAIG